MKISDKHSAAARANGAKSRGPVTPQGKEISARNAIRHGLLAKCIVLLNEDEDVFLQLLNNYADRFNPVDDVEMSMVEEMAAASWRLRRCMSVETAILTEGIEANPDLEPIARTLEGFRDPRNIEDLDRLERYQNRYERAFQRALDNLIKLRKLVKHEEQPPVPNEPIDPNVCNNEPAPLTRTTPRLVPQPPSRPEIPSVALPKPAFPPPEAPVFP